MIKMVAKRHKKGRPSSSIDRNRLNFLYKKGLLKRRMKIKTHRINFANKIDYFNTEEE